MLCIFATLLHLYKNMKSLTRLFSTAFLVALIHSLCCILPILTLAFGLVNLPYLVFLTSFQPYLFGLQFLLLLYGFYEIYYSRKHASCTKSTRRKEKVALWLTVSITVLIALFPYYKHAEAAKKPQFGMKIIKNIKS